MLDDTVVISHNECGDGIDSVALVEFLLCGYLNLLHGDGVAFEVLGAFPYASAGVAGN
jgi:hypothetical protein